MDKKTALNFAIKTLTMISNEKTKKNQITGAVLALESANVLKEIYDELIKNL